MRRAMEALANQIVIPAGQDKASTMNEKSLFFAACGVAQKPTRSRNNASSTMMLPHALAARGTRNGSEIRLLRPGFFSK